MAKYMARLQDNKVVNIEYWNDIMEETEDLKDTYGIPVRLGDNYIDGQYYRNNIRVLSLSEEFYNEKQNMLNEMAELVDIIYEEDKEVIDNV